MEPSGVLETTPRAHCPDLNREVPRFKKRASLVAQLVKNLPAIQETWVQFLDWEDPLEKEMATHSRILAWRIPQTEEPGRLHRVAKDQTRLK